MPFCEQGTWNILKINYELFACKGDTVLWLPPVVLQPQIIRYLMHQGVDGTPACIRQASDSTVPNKDLGGSQVAAEWQGLWHCDVPQPFM